MFESARDAARSLRRSPGFAWMVIGIFAAGIGLNAAIFTVVDCVLLRPLGYRDADRIVAIQSRFTEQNRVSSRMGGGDYVDLQRQVHGLESVAYLNNWTAGVQAHGRSSLTPIAIASPHFGEVIGVAPVAGRLFGHDDAVGFEAMVSTQYATEQFGSAAAALAQTLRVEGKMYTIVGVLPVGFSFPGNTSVWVEADAVPENLNRTAFNQRAIGKRRNEVSNTQLAAELDTFSRQLEQSYPEDRGKAIQAVSLQESITGKVRPMLQLLMGSVVVLLLIVCANVTHLQLVRATRQMREVAVRSALGASRKRLAARALMEVAVLSVASCTAAMLLAEPALRVLVRLAPAGLPRLTEVHLNLHVLMLSMLITVAVMSATALLPIWRVWHVNQASVLRQDSTRGMEGRGAARLRGTFLALQVACTLVLAAVAAILAQQLILQTHEDLGFDMGHLYTLDTSMIQPEAPAAGATEPDGKAQLARDTRTMARLHSALDTLRNTPGVESAEGIGGAPLGFDSVDVHYGIAGRHTFGPSSRNLPSAQVMPVTPGALDTLRVPLLRGRSLSDADTTGSTAVVLINKALADTMFAGQDPIGQRIVCGYDRSGPWTIVGVVGSVKNTPGAAPDQTFYVPVAQHAPRAAGLQYLIRTAPGASLSAEALRLRLQASHSDIAVKATTMAENFSETQRDLRFRSLLFESFAGLSVLIAMLGMYGATAYSVTQRTFEFGVRMALGATRKQVVVTVLRTSAWISAAGAAFGLVLFFVMTHTLASLIGKLHAETSAVVLATLGVVMLTTLAAVIPARRASTIDPIRALRVD